MHLTITQLEWLQILQKTIRKSEDELTVYNLHSYLEQLEMDEVNLLQDIGAYPEEFFNGRKET